MKHSIDFIADPVNKLLICEASGEVNNTVDFEQLIKMIVKMAGKNSVKNVVLDSTQLSIHCSNADMAKLMINIQENGWLDDLKVARINQPEDNTQSVVEALAENLSLSIKDFKTRSEAMLWLLFDKERDVR